MQVIYARESFPTETTKSIFLAGPTPRNKTVPSWRPDAIAALEKLGYDGIVYTPEDRAGTWRANYDDQVEWESDAMNRADCIAFWVPRDLTNDPATGKPVMAALTTNAEWGAWCPSGKVVLGCPQDPENRRHNRYLQHYARLWGAPSYLLLEDTMEAAMQMVGVGAIRIGGEVEVPVHIWRKTEFQAWYQTQRAAGNRLDGAKVEWTCRVGPNKARIFCYVLHVNVHITRESRNKTNEIVLFRPDISAVVMYLPNADLMRTRIVLVKEFRSPANTLDGFVHELPGGSSRSPSEDPRTVVAHEVLEETGYTLDARRLQIHPARQLAATLSAHKGTVFSVSLHVDEMAYFMAASQSGEAHGVEEDTERTYIEVPTVGEILAGNLVDWSTLGMILSVIES